MTQNSIRLPIAETMMDAWDKVKGAKSTIWAVMVCIILIEILIGIVKIPITKDQHGLIVLNTGLDISLFITTFVLRFLEMILGWGLTYFGIQRAKNLPIQFSMIKEVFNIGLILRLLGLFILVFILSFILFLFAGFFIGLPKIIEMMADPTTITSNTANIIKLASAFSYIISLLLVLFAIYVIIRTSYLAIGILIDKRTSILKAMKISFNATKSNVLRIIVIMFLNGIILGISAIPLFIGLIWTIPYARIAYGEVYKRLVLSRDDLNI